MIQNDLIYELNKDDNSFWKELFKKIEIKKTAYSFYEEDVVIKAFESILNSKSKEEIQAIIEYIAQGEKIEKFAFGASSLVFKTGKKKDIVIKIGINRQKYEIPYHPLIMQPLFRKKYSDDLYLEIFNLGEYEKLNITDDEVLEIFKELERAGIFWGDARAENLVVLKKKNQIPNYISGKFINLFGYDDKNLTRDQFTALEVGNYVICDLDFLFRKDDPKKSLGLPCKKVYEYMETHGYNMKQLKSNFIYNEMKRLDEKS